MPQSGIVHPCKLNLIPTPSKIGFRMQVLLNYFSNIVVTFPWYVTHSLSIGLICFVGVLPGLGGW